MAPPNSSDAEFFQQRGFGQKLGFGQRPALLIVDTVLSLAITAAVSLGISSDFGR